MNEHIRLEFKRIFLASRGVIFSNRLSNRRSKHPERSEGAPSSPGGAG